MYHVIFCLNQLLKLSQKSQKEQFRSAFFNLIFSRASLLKTFQFLIKFRLYIAY